MSNFFDALAGAPWWVYVLLIYLLFVGIQATKPRTLSIKQIVLLPAFFTIWSLYGFYQNTLGKFPSLAFVWLLFFTLGIFFGFKEVCTWHVIRNREKGEITIPGNYSTLSLILLIFALKFFWGYFYAVHTEISFWVSFTNTLTTSLLTGLFVGRAVFFIKSYRETKR